MLTGTPLDLTPFGSLLDAIGLAYWLLAICLVGLCLWLPKSWIVKLPLAVIVLGAMVYPVASRVAERKVEGDERKARLDASMALFAERCESAGEKIIQTVENVDGVVWMKWREKESTLSEQFNLDDPYGRDCGLEGCIRQLLRVSGGSAEASQGLEQHAQGYRFVETVDPRDSTSYRYSATSKPIDGNGQEYERSVKATGFGGANGSFVALERTAIGTVSARYGVRWDDISTREDREHWIAGGSLKVIDLKTNEVIGERVGYLIDTGQGGTSGSRSPWGWAKTYAPRCPAADVKAQEFAFRVAQPPK